MSRIPVDDDFFSSFECLFGKMPYFQTQPAGFLFFFVLPPEVSSPECHGHA